MGEEAIRYELSLWLRLYVQAYRSPPLVAREGRDHAQVTCDIPAQNYYMHYDKIKRLYFDV